MSVPYYGDYNAGATVYIPFNTYTSDDPSASVTMTNFINTDVHIHKNLGLTQRNNASGVTVDVDVDGIAGCHGVTIDTSDNTVANFFVSGADYQVRIEGVTVDGATLNPFIGSFSLDNRAVAGQMVATTIATLASQTSFTLTAGSADDNAYNGCMCIVQDLTTAVQKCVGLISDYTGSTKTVTLAEDPGVFTMAANDNIKIYASSALANVRSVNNTLQTANDNGADINAILDDTAEIGAAGAGLTAVPWNAAWDAEVQSECADALTAFAPATEAKQDIIDTNVDAILVDTAEIGAAGAGLTAVPWNAAWDAEVQSECTDALNAYDPPTNTEMTSAFTEIKGATWSSGSDTLEHIRNKQTDIETDTAEIGAAGAGLTAVPWNAAWDAEVQSEVQDAIEANKLDHLVAVADADDVVDDSIIAKLADNTATADWSGFDNTAHSIRALRVRGDAAWVTGAGGSLTEILNVQPLIPYSIDLADTAVVRIGLGLTNMLDDLPSTAEISVGTIAIDRKAAGGTSWTNIVNDAACSEVAGLVYYDEVFDSGTGYAEGDSIRITFKSQKITVAANDYEITGTDGWIFHTHIRQDAALVKRILGLTHENFRIKDQVYDTNNKLTSATIRIYDSAADCTNDTSASAEYTITATYDSDSNCSSYTSVKA